MDAVAPAVDDFLTSLPEAPAAGAPWGAAASSLLLPKKNEALTVPTQVRTRARVYVLRVCGCGCVRAHVRAGPSAPVQPHDFVCLVALHR